MSWRFIHQAAQGARPARAWADPNPCAAVVQAGSLQIEVAVPPGRPALELLHAETDQPWPAGIALATDGQGGLTFRQWQDGRQRSFHMPGVLGLEASDLTLLLRWDAPGREAIISASIAATGAETIARFPAPLPVTSRQIAALGAAKGARRHASVRLLAFADHLVPLGPLPGFSGDTLMPAQDGLRPISQLRTGEHLVLPDGALTQVRWVGRLTRPAWGWSAPVRLRAPHFGAIRDLVCTPDQRLTMRSCEVEYLFATDHVAALVGDLPEGVGPAAVPDVPLADYWQVVLDRPVPIRIGGLDLEPLDMGRLRGDPALHRLSLLAGLPAELFPMPSETVPPVLRRFETWTLCRLRAA